LGLFWRANQIGAPPMIIRDVLFLLGCAAGALLAISQYIVMFSE
jgi:hypothetical protein